jgi:hypothetical protein
MTNRRGEIVTTAVTNMDLHDIARTARTYGASGYFVVTPVEDQHELVGRILSHWATEQSRSYHPDRFEALSRIRLVRSFEEVKQALRDEHGVLPEVILTDARPVTGEARPVSYEELRQELKNPETTRPVVVVFGTGWGIAPEFYPEVHRILPPVYGREGPGGYNHLSVRAAVAAILDRLCGG